MPCSAAPWVASLPHTPHPRPVPTLAVVQGTLPPQPSLAASVILFLETFPRDYNFFFKLALLGYNLHAVEFTTFKCTVR